VSSVSTPTSSSPTPEQNKTSPAPAVELPRQAATNEMPSTNERGVKAIAALEQMKKTTPPLKKFLEAKDAQDLKLKEVDELLKDYQRLAAAMRSAIHQL
jgi:hypothetical protein